MKKPALKTVEMVGEARVGYGRMTVFDPLPSLTPTLLVQYHDQFRRGYLRNAAQMWDRIEELDDKAQAVIPKRKKAASRHGYEFILAEGQEKNPQAEKHRQALKYAYEHVRVTSAVDRNHAGGVALLLRQMLDAVGKRYSVHEIVWKPSAEGISAEFRHVPLWLFENANGKLRYLASDAAVQGADLEQGGWMVTVGDGLMFATAVCYLYKRLPLRDWLVYSQRVGGLHGKTNATKGSETWEELEDALGNMGLDLALLTDKDSEITALDVSVKGELPWPPLIDLMNRAIATLWRGGDLSTMSASGPDSVGASVQGDETDVLEQDDAELLTDTLNEQFDRWVIRYAFDEEPLAWVRIKTSQRQDIKQDLEIDKALSDMGWTHTLESLSARYGRTAPQAGETPLEPRPAAAGPGFFGGPGSVPAFSQANEEARAQHVRQAADDVQRRLVAAATTALAEAEQQDYRDVAERLRGVLELEDPALMLAALEALRRDLPALLEQAADAPHQARVLDETLAAALLNGWAEGMGVRTGAAR